MDNIIEALEQKLIQLLLSGKSIDIAEYNFIESNLSEALKHAKLAKRYIEEFGVDI